MDEPDALAAAAELEGHDRSRACQHIAAQLHAEGREPTVGGSHLTNPGVLCAEHYWRLRLKETPTVTTAAECGRWAAAFIDDPHREITQRWAMRFGLLTAEHIESRTQLAEVAIQDDEAAYFATQYHAAKLRADLAYDDLAAFLPVPLMPGAGDDPKQDPLLVALLGFAAMGSPKITTRHAHELLEAAWGSPGRTREVMDTCLYALALTADDELLPRARDAVAIDPHDHRFRYFLAIAYRHNGQGRGALDSIDTALRMLGHDMGDLELYRDTYIAERQHDQHAAIGQHQETVS